MTIDQTDSTEAATEATNGASRVTAAPYMPGKTFTGMFEKYATDGLPDVFDISFFGGISGSTIAQVRSTMRYFDLIDDKYVPTDLMRDLVLADEDTRKGIIRMMVEEKYADLLALSLNATSGQLAKAFNERGISGATVDKAIAFYLHLLDYLAIPYSGHFKKRRPSSGSTRKRKPVQQDTPPPPPPPPVAPKVTTEQEQKAAYVTMLMELAKTTTGEADMQQALLDRIEKALGIGGTPPSTGGAPSDLP